MAFGKKKEEHVPSGQEVVAKTQEKNEAPSGFNVIKREFLHDKWALTFLILLAIVVFGVIIWSFFLNTEKVMEVNIFDQYDKPGTHGFILGAEQSGRDVLKMLILGTRNSLFVGLAIAVVVEIIGVAFGVISGYYGGAIDNIMMRILDFMMTLPSLLIVIVIVSIIPKYSVFDFVMVLALLYWFSTARLIRSKALSESERDYISASKTSGSSDFKIIFKELLPNLSSIIIVDFVLNLTAFISTEVGLTFLGFGLPEGTPSLGTLISYANDTDVLTSRQWVWMPAALMILFLCVGIAYIGNVIRRAFDARQRLG